MAAKALRRNTIGHRTTDTGKIVAMPNSQQPDFEDEFNQAIVVWRETHQLREDDAVLLLVELFRIHQRHWDDLRRREIPSFEEFRADIAKLADAARTFQGQSTALLEKLRGQRPGQRDARITRAAAFFAAIAAFL